MNQHVGGIPVGVPASLIQIPRFAVPSPAQRMAAMQPSTPALGSGGPQWGDISGLFREALASLSGEGEKVYQSGKRRTLADIAMQSVQSGMANTLNLPAAGTAYDEANRPTFNMQLGAQKAGILQNLGQVGAQMYGQNLGAQTTTAQQGLQRYIAELQASPFSTKQRVLGFGSGWPS